MAQPTSVMAIEVERSLIGGKRTDRAEALRITGGRDNRVRRLSSRTATVASRLAPRVTVGAKCGAPTCGPSTPGSDGGSCRSARSLCSSIA